MDNSGLRTLTGKDNRVGTGPPPSAPLELFMAKIL